MSDLTPDGLARVDRSLLSGLGHDERYRMVRVPVSEALWSTWRRYCDALGISMGRALAALIEHELRSVVDCPDGQPVFLAELEDGLGERQAALDTREQSLEVRERWLKENERRRRLDPSRPRPAGGVGKVGRNDPCPCRSGLKYKRCCGS